MNIRLASPGSALAALLALRNGVYPVSVGAEGVVSFIPFKPSDGLNSCGGRMGLDSCDQNWHIVGFGSNAGGRIVIAIENPGHTQ